MDTHAASTLSSELTQDLGETAANLACVSCSGGRRRFLYGESPSDGLVVCRECRAPLFYCDVGGQG